jgi:hypothetical protein
MILPSFWGCCIALYIQGRFILLPSPCKILFIIGVQMRCSR